MTHLRIVGFGVCLLGAAMGMASCGGNAPTMSQPAAVVDTRAADEAAIRAADAAWSKAAGDKDVAVLSRSAGPVKTCYR